MKIRSNRTKLKYKSTKSSKSKSKRYNKKKV